MSDLLTPELVLRGYLAGVFPMADDDGAIYWFSPDPRCVFEYERFHVPKSLRPKLNRRYFDVRIDTAFEEVIAACADRHEGTWISPKIKSVYTELHRRGFAHSVECWRNDELVGGLYGVAIGSAFFGESMFHHATDASKIALVALMERCRLRGFTLIDTQWTTPHLARFGAIELPRDVYLQRLKKSATKVAVFGR